MEKRKRGRPPKLSNVEKKVEKELLGKIPEKRKPGRPALDYDDRPEHIRNVIDWSALGYSPTRIVNMLKEKYGATDDRVISIKTVDTYRKRYFVEVQKREKELRAELAVLDPVMRIRYLQRVVDEAFEGTAFVTKTGDVVVKKDHTSVIQAIKEINAMQKDLESQKSVTAEETRNQREVQEQKEILREFVEEQMTLHSKSALEILQGLTGEAYSKYNEAIEQLTSEYRM